MLTIFKLTHRDINLDTRQYLDFLVILWINVAYTRIV